MFSKLILRCCIFISRILLSFRYKIKVVGLDEILARGKKNILLLPNHPGMLDPIMTTAFTVNQLHPHVLADKEQIDRFVIRRVCKIMGVIAIEDVHGQAAAEKVAESMKLCSELLKRGDNMLIYPSGHVYRTCMEDLRGNSGAYNLVKDAPDARVVLVRTLGLWGSGFTWANGTEPRVGDTLKKGIWSILKSLLFFVPKRNITIEFYEPEKLPMGDKFEFNEFLENYYNEKPERNTYVPFTPWEGGGTQILPEVESPHIMGDPSKVSPNVRDEVFDFIEQMTCHPADELEFDTKLGHDLGLDSLSGMELVTWLQDEFGFAPTNIEEMQTVGDVVLAAAGEGVASASVKLKQVPPQWFKRLPVSGMPENLTDLNVAQAILIKAAQNRKSPIMADQMAGVKTYGDLILAMRVLVPHIKKLPGEHIGIMMPASVTAAVLYAAAVFAGKIPTMINWTLGRKNLEHCLKLVPLENILTAHVVVSKVEAQGADIEVIKDKFTYVEELAASIGKISKIAALVETKLSWARLRKWAASVSETAVVLFTSGSENLPKAVPLTHKNVMNNLNAVFGSKDKAVEKLDPEDVLLGILPPFHSFGVTVCTILPLIYGARVAYSANPTDGAVLAKMIEAYESTLLIGTPTFLNGIMRASSNRMLSTLKLVVTGAEKCPQRVYDLLSRRCPQTIVLEGYGATECSPVISVNQANDHEHGTIGKILDVYEYLIVNPQTYEKLESGHTGLLLVRGDCVFGGYHNYEGKSPFIEVDGKDWYSTGDLVFEHREGGWLTFAGRMKRFVKLGGEMISLPAIESILLEHFSEETDDEPCLAVIAKERHDQPEIILVTTRDILREEANGILKEAGMSGLHNIRVVRKVSGIPLLGTGKTDYRTLSDMIR